MVRRHRSVALALLTAATLSAAVVQTASAASPAPTYNWTGSYVGGNAGYGWGNNTIDLSAIDTIIYRGVFTSGEIPGSSKFATKGFLGGIQGGYNYQSGQAVFGVEADFSYAAIRGSKTNVSTPIGADPTITTQQDQKLEWFSTLRGRAGYVPTPSLLAFATGGLAVGRGVASTSTAASPTPLAPGVAINCIPGDPAANGFCSAGTAAKTMVGWTIGAGLESFIARNWTMKVEYLYYDLGHMSYTDSTTALNIGTPVMQSSAHFNGNIVRAGLNYRFGGP